MWLFTKYGFFSVVCARKGDGEQFRPIDPARLMVRARVRDHLQSLQQRFPQQLGGCAIAEFTGTDYPYRLFVPKAAWEEVSTALVHELDFDNFKDAVWRHQGKAGEAYEECLHTVWSVMYGLQEQVERGGSAG